MLKVLRYSPFLVAMAIAAPGLTQDQSGKQAPPPGGQPKDFRLPSKHSYQLDNGLRVTLVPFGSLPKVSIQVMVSAGNINDGDDTWLSELTGDLLEEGTTTRSAEEVAQAAAAMGGSININTGPDRTVVSTDVLADFGTDAVTLVADVIRNPALPSSELERLRRDRLRNLNVALSRPQTKALMAFRAALYGDHPYGKVFPSEQQLRSYSLEQIRGFYEQNFGALRTHIYVAGVFDQNAIKAVIERTFSDWKKGQPPLRLPPTAKQGKQYVDIIDMPNAFQSNVYIGLPVADPSDPDYLHLVVTNALLGGSFASRITSNIREDKGYTYSPSGQLSSRYKDAYWVEVAAVTTNVTGPALKEIVYEINRLQGEPPGEEELDGIKNYLAGVFTLQNSTRQGIINQLAFADLHGLDDTYFSSYAARVRAMTPAEISATASKYLRDEDMTVVIVGDRTQIAEQVAAYTDPPG